MAATGLRNWRGEIVEPKSDDNAKTAPDGALEAPAMSYNDDDMSLKRKHDGVSAPPASSADAPSKKEEKVVLMHKDEFGRDVPEDKRSRKGGRKKKESKKRSHKKKKSRRESRSRSPSEPRGRLVGTPPPADPYRPQLDENRHECARDSGSRHHHRRGRSASRSRSRSRDRRRQRHRRDSRSRSSSRDRHRHRRVRSSRSRSRSPSRPKRRVRRDSPDRKQWTHDAFENRSPSPVRQVDPFYTPEPEAWVSRAGGVYMPKKNQ
ncbi:hypothetical protein Gpo141_00012347 [Globisporangium polare]